LGNSNEAFRISIECVNRTLTDRLTPGRYQSLRLGNDRLSHRWLGIVDRVLSGKGITTQREATGERKRVVRQVADDTAVNEPMLLLEFGTIPNPDFGSVSTYVSELSS
jgi:hypothetical protein